MKLLPCFLLLIFCQLASAENGTEPGNNRFRRQDIVFPDDERLGGASCTTYQGGRGVCRPASQCRLHPRTRRNICHYRARDPIICCPDSRNRVTLPADCGRANTAMVYNDVSIAMSKKRSLVDYINPHVIGGRTSQVSGWPWMAAVGTYQREKRRFRFFCGGALIHPRYVLTAAHCIQESPTYVRLGDHNLHNNRDGARPINVRIQESVQHEHYNYPSLYYDIALIRLSRNVYSNYHIRPICLPPPDLGDMEGQWTVLTGWGYTSAYGDPSDTLQQVELQVLKQQSCRERYKDKPEVAYNFPDGIVDTQLCAAVEEGGKDACSGDSGGPLTAMRQSNGRYMEVGIVSAGLGCGYKEFPGVYTRVSRFINWIMANMKP